MTVISLTDYNTRCYGVTFENNGCIKVQKFEDISNHENNFFCEKPLEFFLGKSKVCGMTLMSGALDKSVVNGNTMLLELSEESGKHRFVYIGGDMICSSLTNYNVYKNISILGNNQTPYSIAIGHENIFLNSTFQTY